MIHTYKKRPEIIQVLKFENNRKEVEQFISEHFTPEQNPFEEGELIAKFPDGKLSIFTPDYLQDNYEKV